MDLALSVTQVAHGFTRWGYLTVDEGYAAVESVSTDARSLTAPAHRDRFKRAILEFKQRWAKYDLPQTDELDEQTAELINRRFCNCSDFEEINTRATGLRKWDSKSLRWSGDVRVGQLSWTQAQQYTRDQTLAVCGMSIKLTGVGRVNLESIDRHIDGAGGTLAQAYLPSRPSNASRETLRQEFDRAETRLSQHEFNLVALHEVAGHSLGLSHDQSSRIAVMDPYLNGDLDGWQAPDISELQARYGLPGVDPGTPEPPVDPPDQPSGGLCPPRERREFMRLVSDTIRRL